MSYLLDTNVISELVKITPNQNVIKWFRDISNDDLFISVLTLGEIRTGVEKVTEPKRRSKLLQWLEHDLPKWFDWEIMGS